MAFTKAVLATVALTLLQSAAAWNVEQPPCPDKFTPFEYKGCYKESSNTLIFRSTAPSSDMTVEKCQAICKGNGFRYSGLEYYGQCYCGAVISGDVADASECKLPCNGDKSQTCGGNKALSIYEDKTFSNEPVTTADYKPIGCYTDSSSKGRALSWPAKVDGDTLTTEKCLSACLAQGFNVAGTEYSRECWCGTVLATDSTKADDSECNNPCKGDKSQTCGGRSRLTVYEAKKLESKEPCGHEPGNPVTTTTTEGYPITTTTDDYPITTTTDDYPITTTTDDYPITTTTEGYPISTTTTEGYPITTTSDGGYPITTTSDDGYPITTTQPPVCTTTHVIPPKCEHKCGEWCAPPIPDWSNQKECYKSYKTCERELASCWKHAGWPGSLDCFEFGKWCKAVKQFCDSDCPPGSKYCNKDNCWNHHKPPYGHGPTTTTYTGPCSTTTKPTTTSTYCPPEPTNICKQPTNQHYGYGPGKPVGGIPLPIVGCNDNYGDWSQNPYKLYSELNSHNCPGYGWGGIPNACAGACKAQYTACIDVYGQTCKNLGWKNSVCSSSSSSSSSSSGNGWSSSSSSSSSGNSVCSSSSWSGAGSGNSGTWAHAGAGAGSWSNWGYGDNSPNNAVYKCQAQYKDCLYVNQYVNPGKECKHWGC